MEAECSGINLLSIFAGYERIIIIDSIRTKAGKPGDIYVFNKDALTKSGGLWSSHRFGLADVMELADFLDIGSPAETRIFALEIGEDNIFSTVVSPWMKEAVTKVVKMIKYEL
jgi:hydrogenase maturation protease